MSCSGVVVGDAPIYQIEPEDFRQVGPSIGSRAYMWVVCMDETILGCRLETRLGLNDTW